MTDLPTGWDTATLADLIDADGIFVDGDWVESKDQSVDGDVRLVQLADVGEGAFRDKSNRRLTQSKANQLRCTHLLPGDILVARMPDPLGRACIYPGGRTAAVTVVDVAVLRVNLVNRGWLMWILNSPQVRKQVLSYQSGTTRKRISRRNLEKVTVRVPPLAEQGRIVAALNSHLSCLDALAASVAQAARRGRVLWQSLLESVAKGSLHAENRAWPIVAIGDYAVVQGGIQKQPKRRPARNSFPFLRVANVLEGSLDLSDVHLIELFAGEHERLVLQNGDLLVVEGNGSPDQVGRAALWRGEIPDAVHQNHLIRVRPGEDLSPDYLELVWNSPQVRRQLRLSASSTSGLHTLSARKVKAICIAVPPREVQNALVEEASRLGSRMSVGMANIQAATARMSLLRRSLLAEAFAGRLVPQDPNDEPASELLARIKADRAATTLKRRTGFRRTQKELTAPPTRVTGDDYEQEALPL